jgi:LysM repeat protein
MGNINSQKMPDQVLGQEKPNALKENTSVPDASRYRDNSLFRAQASEHFPKGNSPYVVVGDPRAFAGLYQEEALRNAKRPAVNYEVKAGDTLIKIAEKYNVSLKQINHSNPHHFSDKESENLIRVGDILRIPATKDSVYKVASGDTFSGIAAKHNVQIEVLKKANPIFVGEGQSINSIKAGQELVIPGGKLKLKGELALKQG